MHISVLQEPILALFRDSKLNAFIDATLGACGHTMAILQEHPEINSLTCFDRDESCIARAKLLLPKATLIHKNFSHLKEYTNGPIDGILFDLGVSSMQLDQKERGFSFMHDGPLDMRMDVSQSLTAEDVVNSYQENDLANIIYTYGEEHASRRIAKAIVQRRRKERILTTADLAQVVESVLPRRGKIHPATKTFQAIRMEVNKELESIERAIDQAVELLAPDGILAIISFHSLEDRIVKQKFKALPREQFEILTKKPIIASDEECRQNPRSRSAKLRAVKHSPQRHEES